MGVATNCSQKGKVEFLECEPIGKSVLVCNLSVNFLLSTGIDPNAWTQLDITNLSNKT